jgi:hypothetical protein
MSRVSLVDTLPQNASVIACIAHKFLATEICDMYLSQMIIPLADGTIIIP